MCLHLTFPWDNLIQSFLSPLILLYLKMELCSPNGLLESVLAATICRAVCFFLSPDLLFPHHLDIWRCHFGFNKYIILCYDEWQSAWHYHFKYFDIHLVNAISKLNDLRTFCMHNSFRTISSSFQMVNLWLLVIDHGSLSSMNRLYRSLLPVLFVWKECRVPGFRHSNRIVHDPFYSLGLYQFSMLYIDWRFFVGITRMLCCMLCLWLPQGATSKV